MVDSIIDVLEELVNESGINSHDKHLMAAGITTMTCCGRIDPKYLRLQPYVPPATFSPVRAVT